MGNAYARETRVRRNLKQAVLYPAVLTLLMGAIIAVVVFCVMPVFSQVLRSLGSGLYATAEGVTQVGMAIGIAAMVLVGVLILARSSWRCFCARSCARACSMPSAAVSPFLRRVTAALNAERFALPWLCSLAAATPSKTHCHWWKNSLAQV